MSATLTEELLAALKAVTEDFEEWLIDMHVDAKTQKRLDAAKEAIAKAEGRA